MHHPSRRLFLAGAAAFGVSPALAAKPRKTAGIVNPLVRQRADAQSSGTATAGIT